MAFHLLNVFIPFHEVVDADDRVHNMQGDVRGCCKKCLVSFDRLIDPIAYADKRHTRIQES